jgi:hypothetical protein
MAGLDEVILGASGLVLLYFTVAWLGPFLERVMSLVAMRSRVHRDAGSTTTPGRV